MVFFRILAHGRAVQLPAPSSGNRYWRRSWNHVTARSSWDEWLWCGSWASKLTTSDEAVVDEVRVALRRGARCISVGGKETRLSKAQWESFQLLAAAGPSGVTYAELNGFEAPLSIKGFRGWRNLVHQTMCKLNAKLARHGIPLVACPISKDAYVLVGAQRLEAAAEYDQLCRS